jgi:hypothetical protein
MPSLKMYVKYVQYRTGLEVCTESGDGNGSGRQATTDVHCFVRVWAAGRRTADPYRPGHWRPAA